MLQELENLIRRLKLTYEEQIQWQRYVQFQKAKQQKKTTKHLKYKKSRTVRCVNDGNIFETVALCAEYYGINSAIVSQNIKRKGKTKTGLVFEFVENS